MGTSSEWWETVKTGEGMSKWSKQGGMLHSNEPINMISGFPEMASRMFNGNQSLGQAFAGTFTEKTGKYIDDAGKEVARGTEGARAVRKTKWGKLAASTWAAGTALSTIGGAVRGAITDKNGNLDIPGIPFI